MPDIAPAAVTPEPDGPGLLAGTFGQTAYVTNDFKHALTCFGEVGISRFLELPDIEFPVSATSAARCHIGLAVVGGREVELIEPRGGDDEVYRTILAGDGFDLRLHHVAYLLEDVAALADIRSKAQAKKVPLPVDAAAPQGVTYLYADLRSWIGHHVEYAVQTPEFRAAMADIVPVY